MVYGVRAGMTLTIPQPCVDAKGHDRAYARRVYTRPSHAPPCGGRCQAPPAIQTPHTSRKEHPMITQPHMIVLQLTDALLAQLQPFIVGLDIIVTSHREQRLTMRSEVYAAL